MGYIYIYLASLVIFLGIDAVWLKTMTGLFYEKRIGHLLAEQPNMTAAGVFYLFYLLALCIIILYPQIRSNAPIHHIFLLGALIGLMAYGTYDFTSLALYKGFTLDTALVDFAWGGILTGSVSAIVAWLAYRFHWLS
ncbi:MULTISPECIES: DUF2177 family protein [Psychrobacter]|jgi:uncharacterized membrane protein|uniref:Transmembrane protein n=1 Tax=Psychrobacter cryohalolentis (strain ATCC BAA-1226 / DSM 17306 / VKM B-2378 / K5) TaxID=335284 RepID=Q1QCT9_PSYCK|nr:MULTISPECIES: DUF2177 family protein [Psychrobacter]ABE74514.1 conserved hypothetical protein [Psychrobacter cryohalolentis K5]AGP48365.1 hypothetical protein PSYCG_04170 [Psychrobacter sp. G]ASE27136.1 DUF2177 domain-containing protein [Psychrobacter cryohalolentis]KAA0925479.1 DUF2177 family protein [Psychrobacter sp. ANT_H56B]KAA0930822.1 DUF2177 family protein [Psychrobacter sp. ANT_H59]